MGSLKTFIKSVRKSKTIAAERAAIRKESAHIRSSFRDPMMDNERRNKNIQKLIYLYILGEPTYFGQVECLKLLVSNKFNDKRIGYMATMLIFDESQDILTLLTNSLDLDLKSSEMFISSMALTTLGNIASSELAKDLYPQVELLMKSSFCYIKKKAIIVAAKLIEKEPTLAEIFLPYIPSLLDEKDHGVLLSTLYLIESLYLNDKSIHDEIFKSIPKVLSHLKFLITVGYLPEYDVKGVPDPFLFVSLLRTLRIIMVNINLENLEVLNDLLTQICAKFENSKSSGYSVLYECVKTIFSINSDSSLRILGVNILSKFLVQKDNNIRYVALDTLLNVIEYEPLAVQRHRAIIVNCLNDPDISIRRRALELTFTIINSQNIKLLTKEILKFLKNDDDELKDYITNQLTICLIKYSSNDSQWILTQMIDMLKIAGNYCNENVLSIILAKIIQNGGNNLNLINMILELKDIDFNQYGLSIVSLYSIGEFSNLINNNELKSYKRMVAIVERILILSTSNFNEFQRNQLVMYLLNCCLKLSVKIKIGGNNESEKMIENLRSIIKQFENDFNLEIQSRSVEYSKIYSKPLSLKKALLESMPAPPIKQYNIISLIDREEHSDNINGGSDGNQWNSEDVSVGGKSGSNTGDLLLDLLGGDNGDNKKHDNNSSEKPKPAIDILSDIFGDSTVTVSNNTKASMQEPDSMEAFNDGNIKIGIINKMNVNGKCELEMIVKSLSGNLKNITVLCAVPKTQKLHLSSLNKTDLVKEEFGKLQISITGKEGAKIKIRVKLSYTLNTESLSKQFDFSLPS